MLSFDRNYSSFLNSATNIFFLTERSHQLHERASSGFAYYLKNENFQNLPEVRLWLSYFVK